MAATRTDDADTPDTDVGPDSDDEEALGSRKRAFLYISPFLALGLADIVLLLLWGLDGLWGFMILPPILFISAVGWIAFRHGYI